MRALSPAVVVATFVLFAASACTSWPMRVASSIPIPANGVRTLELTCPEPTRLNIEIWNRGPGAVTFRSFDTLDNLVAQGPLVDADAEYRMFATTERVRIEFTGDATGATVAYIVRSKGSVARSIRELDAAAKSR
jgi:hypothetical protein